MIKTKAALFKNVAATETAASLKGKILLLILPFIIVGLVILTGVSYKFVDSVLQEEILKSSDERTVEVADNINSWLDARLLEVQTAATNPAARNATADPAAATKNNVYRLQLMQKLYPNVYDSVSWGYFDNSGVLWGQAESGAKPMTVGDKDWYKETMKGNKEAFMSSPVVSQATGKTIVNAIALIKDDSNKNSGMILAAIYVQALADKVEKLRIGEKGYSILVSQDGTYIYHPDKDSIMKKKISESDDKEISSLGTKMLAGESGIQRYTTKEGTNKIAFYQPIRTTGWSVATIADEAELFAPAARILKIMAGISVVMILIIMFGIVFVINKLMQPLQVMLASVREMAKGDFRDKPICVDTKDELGVLAEALRNMREEVHSLMSSVNETTQTLAAASEEMNATSEQSSQASAQVATSITEVAQGMGKQLEAVDGATHAIEELSSNIRAVSNKAEAVAAKSTEASDAAKGGGQELEKAIEQMQRIETSTAHSAQVVTTLGEKSKEIGQIVDTISGIAGQTNLLALNAAIEAARAGEQGRGFAVVAEEVRKLAENSQEAAQQIADLIAQIQTDTQNAVLSMQDGSQQVKTGTEAVVSTGDAFRRIIDFVQEVSGQVHGMSKAIGQMAASSQTIVSHVKSIDGLSKKAAEQSETVSAATEEQAASIQEISNASQSLAQMAEKLQNEIRKFQL